MDNEYLPIHGLQETIEASLTLAFGENSSVIHEGRIAALQALSGTGAFRLIGEFIHRFAKPNKPAIYLPSPTWGNHFAIFNDSGLETRTYRYYDPETKGLDLAGMLTDLSEAPDDQVVVLHAAAHNPTGVDPNLDEWARISQVVSDKGHMAVFDMAYQGFASGDPERDAASVRMFVNDGHDVALAQSFSKNLGLYGHRVGCASLLCKDPAEAKVVQSQLKVLARAMYSNPPIQGARIVALVLGDPSLKAQWLEEVACMANRIITMRFELRNWLEKAGSTLDWCHITNQIGMFNFTGMTQSRVNRLASEYNIYMTSNGRISLAGLSSTTVPYLAEAMHQVTK